MNAAVPSPEDLPMLFEDSYLVAVPKRPGLLVHPGAGHRTGTLVGMLIASGRPLSTLGGEERAGLVHRLDKDTSDVFFTAKDDATHVGLARQFKERLTWLLCCGRLALWPGLSAPRRPSCWRGRGATHDEAHGLACFALSPPKDRGRDAYIAPVPPDIGRVLKAPFGDDWPKNPARREWKDERESWDLSR